MYQWRTTLWLPVEPWCKTMIFFFFLIYKRKDTSRFIILGSGWCHRRKWGGPLSGRGRVFCSLCGWRHHADTKTLFWKYSCLWPLSWISVGSAQCNSSNNEERRAIFRSLQDLWQWWRNPPMSRKIPLSEWWITSAWQKRKTKHTKTSLPSSTTKQNPQSFGLQETFLCLRSGWSFLSGDRVCGQQSNTQGSELQQHRIEARWRC